MILETKIDDSFPIRNFQIDGFSTPFQCDRDANGDGIRLYRSEDIPANLLATENAPLESLYMELDLTNTKRLLNCFYNSHKKMIEQHLVALDEYLDLYSSNYEKILILGDFNFNVKENHMKCFCDNYDLKTLIRKSTCYKNFENLTCIDLMLTNVPLQFSKHMCHRNRFIWYSCHDFDCYEKRISKISVKNNHL